MRRVGVIFVALLLLASPGKTEKKQKPVVSQTPLSAEELELYGIFLDSFAAEIKQPVNLADNTVPFSLSDGDKDGACLKGIELKLSQDAPQVIHGLPSSIVEGRSFRLVDPKTHKVKDPGKAINNGAPVGSAVKEGFRTGLLSVSEIAFDQAHRFAVFRYGFYCGSLCGNGAMLLFEKVDGKWKKSERRCSFWIS
jgi:hypothetical protein